MRISGERLTILPHILIAGGGIGGLTAALALARAGARVTVLERAALFEAAGAGLQLSPNASRVLEQLGVLRLLQGAVQPQQLVIRRGSDGRELATMPLGAQAEQRWHAPLLVVHRADLQRALLEACALAGGAIAIVAGAALTGFGSDASGVTASYKQGAINRTMQAGGLVGADGLESLVRQRLQPGGPKIYVNRTAWRTLVEAEAAPVFALKRQTNLWLGKNAHLVHYPVRSGALVNIVAIIGDDWRAPPQRDLWDQDGDAAFLTQRYSGWHSEARALLAAAPGWRKWPLFTRAPLPHFGEGRVTLLGDAAHPMVPFLAQGSAQAIEDAAVLGTCFARQGEVAAAFAAYSAARAARTAKVQQLSLQQGKIAHLSGPAGFFRDLTLRTLSPSKLAARYDWLYGFDVGV